MVSSAAFPVRHTPVSPVQQGNTITATVSTEPNTEQKKKQSGVFGFLSLVAGLFPIFFAPSIIIAPAIAVAFGIAGLKKQRRLKGLAAIGLILGILGLILIFYSLAFLPFR